MEEHNEAVAKIAQSVKSFHQKEQPFRVYHGSTNSTRQIKIGTQNMVDISKLSHVLKVDAARKTALVEPNVPMDRLVEATLEYGLVPPVVMEFPGITAGGGFSGTSGESSSFRHGYFDRTVTWFEMVLANGDVVEASSSQKPDLFAGAASLFGTLGITTLLEIQLIGAKSYVELTYIPIHSVKDALVEVEKATADSRCEYLDGILFAKDQGVICTGYMTNSPSSETAIQTFSRAEDPWFYLHAHQVIKNNAGPFKEAIPLRDYLFRYDRGAFWVARYGFDYFITPFNNFTRWALDKPLHTRVLYHALHKSGLSKRYIIQDLAVPYSAAEEFANFLDESFGSYPIWLCPLRQHDSSLMPSKASSKPDNKNANMLLNFGVWGPGSTDRKTFIKQNRDFERKVQELNGKKWLYAHAYYTEEEFWNIYDRQVYDALREKYHAGYLPSLYDKVKIDYKAEQKAIQESWVLWGREMFWAKVWPMSGVYGALSAILGGEYLLSRTDAWKRKLGLAN